MCLEAKRIGGVDLCVQLRPDGVIYVLLQACMAHAVKVPSSFLAVVPLIAQTVVMDLAGLQFNRKKSISPPQLLGMDYITPKPMKRSISPPELSKTGQIIP